MATVNETMRLLAETHQNEMNIKLFKIAKEFQADLNVLNKKYDKAKALALQADKVFQEVETEGNAMYREWQQALKEANDKYNSVKDIREAAAAIQNYIDGLKTIETAIKETITKATNKGN